MIGTPNKSQGIILTNGKPGITGFSPIDNKRNPETKGISISTDIPVGTRILWIEQNGCPAGFTKVTGIADKYLRFTDDYTTADDTNAADGNAHVHSITAVEGGVALVARATTLDSKSATITYPAIKFICCEKQ